MIYTRIDTYSVILYSCTILDILNKFHIPCDTLESSFDNSYSKRDVKLGDTFVMTLNGIRVECQQDEFDHYCEVDNIFHVNFTWIRLYLSGEGIDYIHSLSDESFNLDIALCLADFWLDICGNYKVTRVDFAFDYINYEGNEFERLRKLLASADFDDNLSDKGRLFTGDGGGLTYSYRGGKERTIYLGSSGADRMLRIYDKKWQLTNSDGVFDVSKLDKKIVENEITIDTWYRVELQLRERFAYRYLVSSFGDFRYIMGEIADFFDVTTREGKKIAPLHKIFLWTQRTPIIQNAKCSSLKSELSIASDWVDDIAHVMILKNICGYGGVIPWLMHFNDAITKKMSQPLHRRNAYINKVNCAIGSIAQSEGLDFRPDGSIGDLYKADNGAFYVRLSNLHDYNLSVPYPNNIMEVNKNG